jgi:Protein of unknown function (DUF3311)
MEPSRARGQELQVRRVSVGALICGLIPFAGMCFSVPLWDRIDPTIMGVPFNLSWLIGWIVISSACMGMAYRFEERAIAAAKDDTTA